MNDNDECIKAIRKIHECAIKEYLEKPNQKLDESIRNLTDEEFFLLSALVLFNFGGESVTNMNKVIFEAINNAPTVDPERDIIACVPLPLPYKEKGEEIK